MVTDFLKYIFTKQNLILQLTKDDFKKKYLGSYLGIIWAFIQPLVNILILWFVFQVGFKSRPIDDFPFILWLSSAMIPWIFFNDSLLNGTGSILDNQHLVKQVVFKVSILPVIRIYTALYIHLFFVVFLFIIFAVYGYYPTIYNFQVLYYMICCIILVTGLSWLTSSLVLFLKDIKEFISMILQFGFWLTPIFYSLKTMPKKYQILIKLNPVYYITQGYRDSFIYHKWFWQHPYTTIYFWVITCIILIIGAFVYKKLKPHFADVL